MKTHELYLCALLKNPEFIKAMAIGYGRRSLPYMAEKIAEMDQLLAKLLK